MDAGADARSRALALLRGHWDAERGHTYPNRSTYPHQWLWDSCFAAVCWAALGEGDKGLRELTNAMSAQFAGGFVPHMRYAGHGSGQGPRPDVSSFTQPPIYAHAARVLSGGRTIPDPLLERIRLGLEWLWTKRRTPEGLLFVVHPWETGIDDSQRWDSWVAPFLRVPYWRDVTWTRPNWTLFDQHLVGAAVYGAEGEAVNSSTFVCAPASFNALGAHAAAEYAALAGDAGWERRSRELAALMDEAMWTPGTGLWSDVPVVGGGDSARVPTLDGTFGALVTADPAKAGQALDQLADPRRFAAPFGLTFVAQDDPAYAPDGYWRGTAWMHTNYLARLAALRWGRTEVADAIRDMSVRAVATSRFAEHWNARTGEGRGAIPLTWSALVAAM